MPARNWVSETSKALLRIVHGFDLQPFLQGGLRQRDQRLLDVGEGRQHRLAVGLQVLQLHALGLLQLAFQQEAVEDRLGQPCGQRVKPGARPEQRRQRRALHAGGRGQLDLREEGGARRFDAEVGGGELRLGLPDVRPLIEQFRRQARRHPGNDDRGQRAALDVEIRRRARHQQRKRGDILPQRDFERRDRGALGRDQRLLLRQIELRGRAAGELLLDQRQDAFGGGEIAPRDAQLILRGQNLEVGVGDGHDGRERHDLAIVAGRPWRFPRPRKASRGSCPRSRSCSSR